MATAYRIFYYFLQLLLRLAIVYLLFSVIRIVFYLANPKAFPELTTFDFGSLLIAGLRFDTSAIVYVNALLILSYLLPFSFRKKPYYQRGQMFLFISFNFIALLLEVIDAGFFSFSFKRSSISDLSMIINSAQLTLTYLVDYWYLTLLLLFSVWLLYFLFQKTKLAPPTQYPSMGSQILVMVLGIFLSILGARGGWQLRPLSPISATDYVKDMRLAPMVSNTTLNLIFSTQQRTIKIPDYFSSEDLSSIPPLVTRPGKAKKMIKKNVIIIALESFGKDQIGYYQNQKRSNTPFLDSLLSISWTPQKGLANGLRSTQGVVAITAGIPSLMEDPLMFSAYQSNPVRGLAKVLREKGYRTTFFHGSNPGSMEFERFAQLSGFEKFYDKTAYHNPDDYDGNWGIWDLPFFQFFANELNTFQEPFFSFFFSLTSHHPYAVESWFEEKHPEMDKVERSYLYTDFALRKFFDTIKDEPWYNNTLFVITADHIAPVSNASQTRASRYDIPICFFDPTASIDLPVQAILQQIDIYPTILDLLQYNEPYFTFGQSAFDTLGPRYGYMFAENLFQIMDEKFILLFDGKKSTALYNQEEDPMLQRNLLNQQPAIVQRMERQLKAIIQQHHTRMVKNQLGLKEVESQED